jgi:asparaginyl-tRNA synthetase
MDVAEAMIKYILKTVLERCPAEMAFFNQFIDPGLFERLDVVLKNDFVRLSYTKAVELLLASGAEFKYPVSWGLELQTEHERYLTEQIYKCPVFVTDYPKDVKAFYMRLNDDGKTVAAADLLVPGVGEIIGGSQREERLDKIEQRIAELGMDMSQYGWYLELRKYGGVKHAGFGLGFERIIMYLTGMQNIRDVLPFPRTTANMEM